MGEKLFCIRIEVNSNEENFLNMDGAGCTLQKRELSSKRYIDRFSFEDGIKPCTDDGNVCRISSRPARRRAVRRSDMGKERLFYLQLRGCWRSAIYNSPWFSVAEHMVTIVN